MLPYTPPLPDMLFSLEVATRLFVPGQECSSKESRELVESVLEAAAALASKELDPLQRKGDVCGSRLEAGKVSMPPGYSEAYTHYRDGGWSALSVDEEIGGQALPYPLATAVSEVWGAANGVFGLLLMPIGGAVRLLQQFGSETQTKLFLPKLVSGEWTATMAMTEPQAGSDLGAIRVRAERAGDEYRIFGEKSFISFADHDLADNVLHFLLARTADAPPGVRGLTLFLVPTVVNAEGNDTGVRNDVRYLSLEHKLGFHGMPTGTLSYGEHEGAIAYRIGDEHRGIEYMFTLMNRARLSIGLMGLASAERAFQPALAYARERVQGRGLTIDCHADVRRMLLGMKARIEAMRLLAYYAASLVSDAERGPDPAISRERLDLLTPVIKAWLTETGFDVTSSSVQVHGGLGYMEEAGLAQLLREARVHPIFEGTTGIQAADLVRRKIGRDGGRALGDLLAEFSAMAPRLHGSENADLRRCAIVLESATQSLQQATTWLTATGDPQRALAGSEPYLTMVATVISGWLMAKAGLMAHEHEGGYGKEFLSARKVTARFFAEHYVAVAAARLGAITEGSEAVLGPTVDSF